MKTVFLSSTAKDLVIYRDKVYQAVERLGFHCVRMEDFGARDIVINEFCQQKIAKCDLFVCLVGLCYGTTPRHSAWSYTIQEYNAAGAAKIPRLIFVSTDNYYYLGYYHESDEQWQKQQEFRNLVSSEGLRDTFSEPDELAGKVVQAISNWVQENQKSLPPDYFEKRTYSSLESHIPPFDHSICHRASLGDLDLSKVTEFFKRDLVQRQQDFRLGASVQDQLMLIGYSENHTPTYGALLCFGQNPQKWVAGALTRCIQWRSNDRDSGWLENQEHSGNLLTQFESILVFLRKCLRFSRVIGREGRSDQYEIPFAALEEIVANALIHREYVNRTEYVQVEVYDDRIETKSPGQLPPPMTMDLLGVEDTCHPRNPLIAKAFYLSGYIEKVGSGIQRTQHLMKEAGLPPPKFEMSNAQTFKVTLYRPLQVPEEVIESEEFGKLLSLGIEGIAMSSSKPLVDVENELSIATDLESTWLIHRWRQGIVPSRPDQIAALARACVQLGGMSQEWLSVFLKEACYPAPESLIAELYLNPLQNNHRSETDILNYSGKIHTFFLPDDFKQRLQDGVVNFVARQAEKMSGGDQTAMTIRQLSSEAGFNNAFDKAMESAIKRFIAEYAVQDEDLVEAIITDGTFWQSQDVQLALITMISRPSSWVVDEREAVVRHFLDVLPRRINRERVDKAVIFFLHCVLEELWTLPGIGEIREIYSLQFQKIGAEAAQQSVALLEAQLQAATQLSDEVRQALLQLATALEQLLLSTPLPQPSLPSVRPYHNLPPPDYTHFVGRQRELDWLGRRLLPGDRAWQMVIAGIGGVGKSALALAIAHNYRERYQELSPKERFEAIIWITAKEEVLTIRGREKSALSGLIFRTLEDMYTAIAQTLQREDITRALLGEQDHLVQKVLSTQRTLLIVDNMESVTDERVRTFLRNLPVPTKCIITSREWVDVADVLRLTGLPAEEAEKMITEEATTRGLNLNEAQLQLLFERTAGIPLPIKLSVARMASGETFDQVLRWLGDAIGDLPEYCVKGQFDMVRKRTPNAWKLLLACSLFEQNAGISREALGYIADLSLVDRDDGLTMLQRLSLLNCDAADRFWILPMVQGYAGSELVKADFGGVLTERWLNWLVEFTKKYGINLELHVEGAQVVDSQYPHLLSAVRWCRNHEQWEMLVQLVEGTCFYPYLVGLFGELRETLEAGVQATKTMYNERNERCEGRFMYQLARCLRVQGQKEKALECLEKAEEIALRYKDDFAVGQAKQLRSHILYQQGHLLEGEQEAKTVLEIGERLNNLELKVWASQRLAEFESKKHHFDQALEWLDRAEKWCRELGWSRELAWTTYDRTSILIQQGNSSAAEPLLVQSLNMAISCSDRRLTARNKYRFIQVYLDTNRLQLALQMAEEARDLYERLGLAKELAEAEELLQKLLRIDNNS